MLVIVLLGAVAYFFLPGLLGAGEQTVSGTIEASEVQLASELGGRVVEVAVEEGDAVRADDVVAELHQGQVPASACQGAGPHRRHGVVRIGRSNRARSWPPARTC